MISAPQSVSLNRAEPMAALQPGHWAVRMMVLWRHRRRLARVAAISLLTSLAIAFLIPKQYKSTASIMPPDQQGSGAMMLAALASHSGALGNLEGLSSLAGGLLGGHYQRSLYQPAAQRDSHRPPNRPIRSTARVSQALPHRHRQTSCPSHDRYDGQEKRRHHD